MYLLPLNTKVTLSVLLVSILLVSSCFLYYRLHSQNKTLKPTSLPFQVQEALKGYQKAKESSSKAVSRVSNRKPLDQVLKVGSVLSPEVITELQTREQIDLQAIQALQITVSASQKVIDLQGLQLMELEHQVFIWKAIAGAIVIILIVIVL